jgi:hypothetical protein
MSLPRSFIPFTGCFFFFSMEDSNILSRDNNFQMFCLQFVFLLRIQQAMDERLAGWNQRPSRALKGQLPNLQWMENLECTRKEGGTSHAIRNAEAPPAALEKRGELFMPSGMLRPLRLHQERGGNFSCHQEC